MQQKISMWITPEELAVASWLQQYLQQPSRPALIQLLIMLAARTHGAPLDLRTAAKVAREQHPNRERPAPLPVEEMPEKIAEAPQIGNPF